MATPTKLSGASASITIDGTDMHSYGMIVTSIDNPTPPTVEQSVTIPGRDGGYDYTNSYGTRFMNISGTIMGDDHSQLMTNIDGVQQFFRLRKNRDTIKIIFQDQTDRYWTCRYGGDLKIRPIGLWRTDHIRHFSVRLKCVKPYAEATSITTEEIFLGNNQYKEISYSGNLATPLNVRFRPRYYENILEKDAGDVSEDHSLWTKSNCNGANGSNYQIYGTYHPQFSYVSAAAYYAEVSLSSIDTTKNYVLGLWVRPEGTNVDTTTLSLEMTGASAQSVNSGAVYNDTWMLIFLKVTSAQLSGSSAHKFRIANDGSDAWVQIDGAFIYEITATEAADGDYYPPPYFSDPAGDDYVQWINPGLIVNNSINIYPQKNGDSVDDWPSDPAGNEYAEIVDDPFGDNEKCIMFSFNNRTNEAVLPFVYVQGGSVVQVQFEYYHERIQAAGQNEIGIYRYCEAPTNGSVLRDAGQQEYVDTLITPSSSMSDWAQVQKEIELENSAYIMAIRIYDDTESRLFLKNIMFRVQPSTGQSYDSYVKPNTKRIDYTGTIDTDDDLILNSERMTAKIHDNSGGTISNAWVNLSGQKLMLEPGTNVIRIEDDRNLQTTVLETRSQGAGYLTLGYRARYL